MTIHITPEQEFSYVSFETNVAASDYGDLITRVIETFQPGKFVVTILANKVSHSHDDISNIVCPEKFLTKPLISRLRQHFRLLVRWSIPTRSAIGLGATSSSVAWPATI